MFFLKWNKWTNLKKASKSLCSGIYLIFRCRIASLKEGLSIGPSVHYAFSKIIKWQIHSFWWIKSFRNFTPNHLTQYRRFQNPSVPLKRVYLKHGFYDFLAWLCAESVNEHENTEKMMGEIMDAASLSYWTCLFVSSFSLSSVNFKFIGI